MRILVTCSPGVGHVHPMVPLARALAGRGHDVRWAVAAEVCGRVRAAGFDAFPAGIGVGRRHAEFGRLHPETMSLPPADRPDRMFAQLFGEISTRPMLADVLPVVEAWRPALVVHDASELAGPLVAALAGVPSVCHSFGPLLPAVRVAAAADDVAGLWRSHGLEPRPYAGCYDHLYLDIYPPSMRPGDAGHIARLQALQPVPFDEEAGDIVPPAPDNGRPLVYVTFGTLFNDPGAAFRAAIAGVADHEVDVIVTVGPAGDPAALGPVSSNVRVERYVAQTQLLPRCAAVVSHAGSGTFLATLRLGTAQLCLPQAADQFLNARQGVARGVALTLMPDDVSAGAVSQAVGRLLTDPSISDVAAAVAEEIAAMPTPDDVAAVVEALA